MPKGYISIATHKQILIAKRHEFEDIIFKDRELAYNTGKRKGAEEYAITKQKEIDANNKLAIETLTSAKKLCQTIYDLIAIAEKKFQ